MGNHTKTSLAHPPPAVKATCYTYPMESQSWGPKIAAVILLFILFILAIFAWRVFGYYSKIKSGEISPLAREYRQSLAPATQLGQLLAKADPTASDLATTDDPAYGSTNPKLTIVEFADFGCPYSKAEHYVVEAIAKKYAASVKVIYRDFPIEELHPGATLAAQAGECAADQDKFWPFHNSLYRQTDISTDSLTKAAQSANLDLNRWQKCLQSGSKATEVEADLEAGAAAGVQGTPTFFLNGVKIEGEIPYEIFDQVVAEAIK